jgi:hypothetical protein
MKTITSVLAALVISTGLASAQSLSMGGIAQPTTSSPATAHDVTGFAAPSYAPGPGVNPKSLKTAPNPNVVLKPKLGGVAVDAVKYGPEIFSPGAPGEYGMGEKYLSAPSPTYDVQHESGQAAHRDAGGFKLFTIEF